MNIVVKKNNSFNFTPYGFEYEGSGVWIKKINENISFYLDQQMNKIWGDINEEWFEYEEWITKLPNDLMKDIAKMTFDELIEDGMIAIIETFEIGDWVTWEVNGFKNRAYITNKYKHNGTQMYDIFALDYDGKPMNQQFTLIRDGLLQKMENEKNNDWETAAIYNFVDMALLISDRKEFEELSAKIAVKK